MRTDPVFVSTCDGTIGAIRLAFLFAVALTVVPLGSTTPVQLHVSSATHALVFILTIAAVRDARQATRILRPVLLVAASAIAYLALQAAWFSGNPFANPVWAAVAEDLGLSRGAISVAPDATLGSIPALVMPFLAFGSAALLSRDDAGGWRTWRGLALLGIAVSLFGLVRYLAFPEIRLFGQTFLDRGALTSFFVNRNNAATFLGLSSLASLGWLAWQTARLDGTPSTSRLAAPGRSFAMRHAGPILTGLALFATIVALLLTRSRAGIAISLASLVAAAAFIARDRVRRGIWPRPPAIAVAGIWLVGLAGLAILAQRAILRAELGGLSDDRFCLYRQTIAAIRDNWVWGTGFGTFGDVFPAYRNAGCTIHGIPEQAHNSYLEGTLGLGLPFLLLLAATLAVLVSILATGLRERRRLRPIPIVCLAALGLMLAHSAVDFPVQIPGIAVYFAALLGSGAGLSLARRPG